MHDVRFCHVKRYRYPIKIAEIREWYILTLGHMRDTHKKFKNKNQIVDKYKKYVTARR